MKLREKLREAGLTMAAFSRLTNTPYRTVQCWCDGSRRVPGIALAFMELYSKLKNNEPQ